MCILQTTKEIADDIINECENLDISGLVFYENNYIQYCYETYYPGNNNDLQLVFNEDINTITNKFPSLRVLHKWITDDKIGCKFLISFPNIS